MSQDTSAYSRRAQRSPRRPSVNRTSPDAQFREPKNINRTSPGTPANTDTDKGRKGDGGCRSAMPGRKGRAWPEVLRHGEPAEHPILATIWWQSLQHFEGASPTPESRKLDASFHLTSLQRPRAASQTRLSLSCLHFTGVQLLVSMTFNTPDPSKEVSTSFKGFKTPACRCWI